MTRHDDKQIGTYGGYGSGVGTYVIYLALSAVIMLVLRWVC